MTQYLNFFGKEQLDPKYVDLIKKLRASHLESGGDPKDFTEFLTQQGITAIGPILRIEDNAIMLANLLKD